MAAYLIADIEIHNPKDYEAYKAKAAMSVEAFGGRYVARGGRFEVLEGEWQPTRLVIIEFPDMNRLKAWYESAEYGEAKPFRLANATSHFVAVEGVQ